MDTPSASRQEDLERAARLYDIPNEYERVNVRLATRLIRPVCEGKDVLEVGCASGEMTGELLQAARSLTVVEPTRYFSDLVRTRFGDRVRVHQAFLETVELGATFDVVEITPRPPTASSGSVNASSPESTSKSGGHCATTCAIWSMLPDASLTPTTHSICASCASVPGRMFDAVRPGML